MSVARWVIYLCTYLWVACVCLRIGYVLVYDDLAPPYTAAPYRIPPYLCGLMAGTLAVNRQDRKLARSDAYQSRSKSCWAMTLTRLLVFIAFGILTTVAVLRVSTGGYLFQRPKEVQWVPWQFYLDEPGRRTLFGLYSAIMRPLMGLSAAYVLGLACGGRLAAFNWVLGLKMWQPLATLSYSMYLMQFIGMEYSLMKIAKPMVADCIQDWQGMSCGYSVSKITGLVWGLAILSVLITLPMAILLYTFVERPGILVGRRVMNFILAAGAPPAKPVQQERQADENPESSNPEEGQLDAGDNPQEVSLASTQLESAGTMREDDDEDDDFVADWWGSVPSQRDTRQLGPVLQRMSSVDALNRLSSFGAAASIRRAPTFFLSDEQEDDQFHRQMDGIETTSIEEGKEEEEEEAQECGLRA